MTAGHRGRQLIAALMLLSLAELAGCTGSPATLALPPDFDVQTSTGLASVSIRGAVPGMTESEFTRLVEAGMTRAAATTVMPEPVDAPFPERRIVWHVSSGPARGVSALTVNIFDGSVPVSYEREVVANDAPPATVEAAITVLTTRLVTALSDQDTAASR